MMPAVSVECRQGALSFPSVGDSWLSVGFRLCSGLANIGLCHCRLVARGTDTDSYVTLP